MNKKQKIVLWIGITLFVLMGLFPPYSSSPQSTFAPSTHYDRLFFDMGFEHVDSGTLFIQWAILGVITGGLICTLSDKKDKRAKGE